MRRERGVAIIIVMLMISLATIAVTAMLEHQRLEVRRSATLYALSQRQHIARAGEQFAFSILAKDRQQGRNSSTDSPDDDWLTPIPELPVVSGGTISGCLLDLSGRLNVNNLLNDKGEVDTVYKQRFQTLFSNIGLEPNLVNALIDWIDPDQEVSGSDGAESDVYIGLDPPYRAADRDMLSISELAQIQGLREDPELFEELLPHVAALPRGSKLNINMATPEVILSLESFMERVKNSVDPWQQSDDWQQMPDCPEIAAPGGDNANANNGGDYQGPFEQVDDFVSHASVKGEDNQTQQLDETQRSSLDVLSHYFLLKVHTKLGDSGMEQFSVLERDKDGRVKVIWRSQHTL